MQDTHEPRRQRRIFRSKTLSYIGQVLLLVGVLAMAACGGSEDNKTEPENVAPTANAGENQTVDPGDAVTLDGSGSSDPGNGRIAYAWSQTGGKPEVELANATGSAPVFTAPLVAEDATLTFRLTVTEEGGLTAAADVTITITAPDVAVESSGDVVIEGKDERDPGDGSFSYSWTQVGDGPRVVLDDAGNPSLEFDAPTVQQDTILTFEVVVTDADGVQSTRTVRVFIPGVGSSNALPTASASSDAQTAVNPGDVVTLRGSGNDPRDGDITYSWSQTSGPTVQLGSNETSLLTFTAPAFATAPAVADTITLTFEFTITTEGGLAATDEVTVTVVTPLVTIQGDGTPVRSVSISRDGDLAVSGGIDGTVRLWDAGTGAAISTLGEHDGAVYAVAMNPGGTLAISGGADGTVRLWRWEEAADGTVSGSEVTYDDGAGGTRSLGHKGIWVYAVALNADGTRAVSGGFDGKVRLWNTEVTGASAGTEITYDDDATAETEENSLGSHAEHSVYGVAVSDDGTRVLSGGADGVARLWNTDTGEEIRQLTDDDGPMGVVFGVSLSGDGSVAAAGSADNHVHVWNATTGAETHELEGHTTDASSVSLNEAGTHVLSAGADGTVRLWNVARLDVLDGTEVRTLRQHTDYAWSASLSGDGTVALSGGGDGAMHLWNTAGQPPDTAQPFATTERDRAPQATGDVRVRVLDHARVVDSVALSADGRFALSGGEGSDLRLWDAVAGTAIGDSMTGHSDWIAGVSLSADGRLALSGSRDDTLRLWDAATATHLRTLSGHANFVLGASLSPDGRVAVSGGADNTLRYWDVVTGIQIGEPMVGHVGTVEDVALSADGRLALSGSSNDATLRLWDLAGGTPVTAPMAGHTHNVSDVALSADGSLALSASWDYTVRRWDTNTGTQIGEPMTGHTDEVYGAALSADGRLALSGAKDFSVRVWDAATGELLRTLHDHEAGVNDVALSADGRLAVSGGNDRSVRLWSLGRSDDTVVRGTADADAGQDQAVASAVVVTLDGSGSIASRGTDGKPIAYFWRQTAPAGTTLSAADLVELSANDAETATFTAPGLDVSPILEFALTVTDAHGLVDTDTVTVTVLAVEAGDDQTIDVGQPVTLTGAGRATDGGGVTYSWTQTAGAPTVVLEGADAATATFTAPATTQDAILTFALEVADGSGLTATDTVTITVNATPTAQAGADQTVGVGATVTLAGSGTDPGGVPLAYSWVQTAGVPTVVLEGADTATATFIMPAIPDPTDIRSGTLTFTFTVRNDNGLSAQNPVTVRADGAAELFALEGIDATVRGVSISRDGNFAVSGGLDGTVRLWNGNTGAAIRTLGEHDGAVYAVAINADGTHAISGGADGTVRLWTWDETSGGEVLYDDETRSLGNKGIWVYAVALNKDGTRAASGGFDGKVRFWNTEVTGASAGTEITYDDDATAQTEQNSLGSHGQHSVYGVSMSDDGSRVLSGGADGMVRLWNTSTGEEIDALTDDDGHTGVVFGVAFSGDGSVAVAGSADNHVHVWSVATDADTGEVTIAETHELAGHATDVSSVSLSADARRVLSAGADGTVRLWNVDADDEADGTEIRTLRRHTDYAWSASLSGDGIVALSGGGDDALYLWNTAAQPAAATEPFVTTERDRDPGVTGDVRFRVLRGTGGIGGVALSVDGRRALSGGQADNLLREANNVLLWDAVTGTAIGDPWVGHQRPVGGVSLSGDARLALSGGRDDNVRLWDATTGSPIGEPMTGHTDWVNQVALSPDGRLALSASRDNTLRRWDATTGAQLGEPMTGHADVVWGVALSVDGRLALSGGWDNTVRLWNAATGAQIGEPMTGHDRQVWGVALSADGRLALSGSVDGTVRRWDTTTGTAIGDPMTGHLGEVYGVALSADGRLALSGGIDDTVRVWDASTGELLRTLHGHGAAVYGVSLSADGRLALSDSSNGTAHLWSLGRSDDTVTLGTAEADAGEDRAVGAASEVILDGSGSTASRGMGGKPVAYFWRQIAPAGTTLSAADTVVLSANDAETVTFTAPGAGSNPSLEFALTVTDAHGFTATDTVAISILAIAAGDDQTVDVGSVVTLTGSGDALGGGTVSYSWTQTGGTPTVTLVGANTAVATFTAPVLDESATLTFELSVTDVANGITATDTVTIALNATPTARAGDDQTVNAGDAVTLAGSGTDPGGVGLSYSWVQTAGTPTVTLVDAATATATFTMPAILELSDIRSGTLSFTFTVRNDNGLTAQDSVVVRVDGTGLYTMEDHGATVRGVSISRDGGFAVSGGLDGTVRLWNASTGAAIRTLGEHDGAVYAVAINADGTRAISGGADGTVRLWTWDANSGSEVRYPDGQGGTRSLSAKGIWVYAVALNKDGTRAVSGGFDGVVRVWNTATTGAGVGDEITYDVQGGAAGETRSLGSHAEHSVYGVSMSDDGSRVLSGGADGAVRLWNTGTGEEIRALTDDDGPMGVVFGVALSGDGSIAAAGSADNHVHVWNTSTGAETHELEGHATDVSGVSLNQAGTRVLSAGGDGTVRLWNVDGTDDADGTEIRALRQHTDYAWSASLSGDGTVALSGGGDGVMHLWNTDAPVADTTQPFTTIERDRDPRVPGDVRVRVLESPGGVGGVGGVSLTPDGRRALSEGETFSVLFWDATTGTQIGDAMTGHQNLINDMSLSADGNLAVSGDALGTILLWDTATGETLHTIDLGENSFVYGTVLSADGRIALSSHFGEGLRRWDVGTGTQIGEPMTGHTGDEVYSVVLSGDGRRALSGANDNTVRLWNMVTGTQIGEPLTGHTGGVYSVALSVDGGLALSGANDNTVRRWDATTGGQIGEPLTGHTSSVRGVALSGNGRFALSGGRDDTVRLWDLNTGETLRTLRGHTNRIYDVALSADGRLAMSGGLDGTVRLWSLGRSDDTVGAGTADADAGQDDAVAAAEVATLDGSGSTDTRTVGGKPIAYFWRQVAPTGSTLSAADLVTLSADNTETATFTAPSVLSGTILAFALTVTDAHGLVDTDEVTITVAASGPVLAGVTGVRIVPRVRGRGDTHGRTDTIAVEVTFSEAVTVTGSPTLALVIGTQTRQADYVTGGGTNTLTFHYVVQDGDLDADGISIEADALQLNGGSINDADGLAAELGLGSHAIAGDTNHKVDGRTTIVAVTPEVRGVAITSRPQQQDTYGATETIFVKVHFSSFVTVAGDPTLALTIGTEERTAVYLDGSGTATLIFGYIVQAADADTDGIGVAAGALSANGGSVAGSDGSAVTLNLATFVIANAADHKVDGSVDRVAAVTRLDILSRPQSGNSYGLGEIIRVWVDFSEAVTITGTGGPNLRLDIGTDAPVVADAGRGGRWLRFDYVVQAGDTDADGISIAADALQLGSATITDLGGQAASLDLTAHAITNASGHRVDAAGDTAPTADAGPDQRELAGTVVTLDGSGSSDAQTATADLTYAWERLCGPEVTLAGANTASPTFTAAAVLLDANAPATLPPLPTGASPFSVYTTIAFRLTVTDEQSNEDTDIVTVTVAPAGTPATSPTIAQPSMFEGQCEAPSDEKNWLRSWNHEHYFWYDEIVDQDPAGSHEVGTYFDLMKTFAEAPSCGKPKDDFHFYETGTVASGTTSVNRMVRTNGQQTGFGAIFGASSDGQQLLVKYVHPGSPMALAPLANASGTVVATGLRRGDQITRVGTTTINATTFAPGSASRATIEAAILETRAAITLEFGVARGSEALTTSVTSAVYVADPVPRYDVIDTGVGLVGYLLFMDHSEIAEAELIEAMAYFEQRGIADLVLDLRYNQGGLLTIATGLATMIANPSATSGQIYEHLVYNDKQIPSPDDTNYFEASRKYSQPIGDTDLPNLGLNRLFVITTSFTCSASESIINSLRGVGIDVIQIGTGTCGKPYGTTPVPNCGKVYFSTQFVASNAEGFRDYEYGFTPENTAVLGNDPVRVPGCYATDNNHDHPLGDAQEGMLAQALTYRNTNGSCTAPAGLNAHSEAIMRDRPAGTGRIVER